ncbi:ATP-binding protein [Spirosoma sp. SC4-14]|uniref:ATP-binding protein n=1 Tax=Spirosoma sp. SC4-14 TaxID=3128900 RepID=UPI0030D2E3B7
MNNKITHSEDFLSSEGEMGERLRAIDWSKTPLGPIDQWPQSLKTSVNLMLNSQHPMWIGWGPDITFLYNDAYIPVLSLAKHPRVLGQPAAQVWAEIWDFCGPLANKVFQEGKATFVDDVRLFMSRGDYLEETYYSFSYSPIRDESGNVAGLFCPSSEVTEKNLATRRLRTLSELAAKALVEKAADAACASVADTLAKNPDDIPFALLYVLDPIGNQARLEQAIRLNASQEAISPLHVNLENQSTNSVLWPLADVIKTSKSTVVYIPNHTDLPKGLADQPVREVMVMPLISPGQNHPLGVLIAGVNPGRQLDSDYRTFFELVANQVANAIQNARAAEEERNRLEMLAEIDRAKTVFFSNVSHEFRTPLTLMLGPLEEALKQPDSALSTSLHGNIETAYRNAVRLQKLVNTLLDFSRIEAGRMQAHFEALDLALLTEELASSFRSLVESAGMSLYIQCSPVAIGSVYVDREMWEKIILNLLSNAFKYTLAGSITVLLKSLANEVILQIKDTGVGIPSEEMPRLFERFHRVATTRGRTYEGTGIGLSLVKELVLMHGGTITAESQPGVGTTFTVHLPISNVSALPSTPPPSQQVSVRNSQLKAYLTEAHQLLSDDLPQQPLAQGSPSATSSPELVAPSKDVSKCQKILVVDDNVDMRMYIQRLLEPLYQIKTAPEGRSALELIQSEPPDLVLSDIMMPIMDGEQLLRTLKADPVTARIPVMLLSARAGEEAKIDGYTAGADDYLIKPFSANELLARVRAQLSLSQERNRASEQLRSLFEQAPVVMAILGLGPDFVFELANPHYAELVDRSPQQLHGQSLLKALPELAGQGFDQLLAQVTTTGVPYHANEAPVQLIRNSESYTVYLNFVYQPRREANGNITGVLVLATDVTEQVLSRLKIEESEQRYRKLADELEIRVQERTQALSRSNSALERSNFDLMQFASVASHDLKEPLRKIQAFSNILQTQIEDKLSTDELSYFGRITSAASRMQALIDNVLTLSKISQYDLPFEQTDLNALLNRIVEDLEITITEKNARIFREPLPLLEAIPGQMHQLFQNLISNALKFNQSNQPTVTIKAMPLTAQDRHLAHLESTDLVKIRVEDNGIGFDKTYEEKIFGLFQRLHGRIYPGTGIGLAICKKIVEGHHGHIKAESRLGQGTAFDILLPRKQPIQE